VSGILTADDGGIAGVCALLFELDEKLFTENAELRKIVAKSLEYNPKQPALLMLLSVLNMLSKNNDKDIARADFKLAIRLFLVNPKVSEDNAHKFALRAIEKIAEVDRNFADELLEELGEANATAAIEKYKELYDLSIKVLDEEQQRFNRLEGKAATYFTVLSFLIGIHGIFCSKIISCCIPPEGWFKYVFLGLGLIVLLGLITAWFWAFFVIKQHNITKIPITDEMIDFFKENKLIDIYYTLTKSNKIALEKNRKISNEKANLLLRTYRILSASMILMVLLLVLYGADSWNGKKVNSKGGVTAMQNKDEDKGKPKENIKPPTYDQITEGASPSRHKKVKEYEGDKNTARGK
jgi:uncharacterized tellurite resistance protein B-like protein